MKLVWIIASAIKKKIVSVSRRVFIGNPKEGPYVIKQNSMTKIEEYIEET